MASPLSRIRKFFNSITGWPAKSPAPSLGSTPSSAISDSASPIPTASSSAAPVAIPRVAAPGTVFRVTSIPPGTTISDLHDTLSVFPTLKPDLTAVCTSPDSRYLTALIHFASPPPVLTTLKHGGAHTVKLVSTGRRIYIDRDFYGLTQLYPTSEDSPIRADVIAVCGLNGHAYYCSWAGEVDGDGDRVMWLRHLLPEDVPGCRTMIYGYDSNLSPDSNGIHKISDYRDSFLEEVTNARRREEEKERWLVLIGHSFGGIIIAQALVKAKESEYSDGTLFRRTRATMFFGTPHRGFLVDDILAMDNGSTRAALVRSLNEGSEGLATELHKFITYAAGHGMRMVSFKETQQTRKLQQGADGRWARTGPHFTAVEAGSAILVLPETIETSLPAAGNHSTMVKFKNQSETAYQSVINRLEDWLKESEEAAPAPQKAVTAYRAVKDGNAAGLEHALKQPRVNVNEVQQGTTLLNLAVAKGDKECIHILLIHGAKVDIPDPEGNTALHLAVRKGCKRIWAIDTLINEGANITTMCSGLSVLHIAAQSGDEKMVACLLDRDFDIETVTADGNGFTALYLASKAGHVNVVKLRLERKANMHEVGQDGDTPLHSAAWEGQEDTTRALLNHGAHTSITTNQGCTPFHFPAFRGHLSALKLLILSGAEIEVTDQSQRTALHLAAHGGHLEVAMFLVSAKMDMSATSLNKHTALHTAATHGQKDVVQFLLEKGADATATDIYNNTPFDLAVAGEHSGVMEVLSVRKALTGT